MPRFPNREQRREIYMVAGFIVAALGYSHALGYWPYGSSNSQVNPSKVGEVVTVHWGQFLLYSLPLLALGVLYFLGRRTVMARIPVPAQIAPIVEQPSQAEIRTHNAL